MVVSHVSIKREMIIVKKIEYYEENLFVHGGNIADDSVVGLVQATCGCGEEG